MTIQPEVRANVKVEEILTKAQEMELEGVDFLDARGRYVRDARRQCTEVRIKFIDGTQLWCSWKEFQKIPDDFNFKLRPTNLDS